jgi:hypothetical protein
VSASVRRGSGRGIGASFHLGADFGNQLLPVGFGLAHAVFAELLGAFLKIRQLFRGVVAFHSSHLLNRRQNVVNRYSDRFAQASGDAFETQREMLLGRDVLPELVEVHFDHLQRGESSPVQQVADLVQPEAELAERTDLLQADDVGVAVEAVTSLGPTLRG